MRVFLSFLLAFMLLFSLAGCGSTSDGGESQPPQDQQQAADIEQDLDDGEEGDGLKYGELVSITDNRDSKGVVIVKAKITPNISNSLTVSQNFHNVVDLIQNQGYDDCELQYWAVADMSSGSEDKVVSFTVPQDLVGQIAAGDVVATQLEDLVEDLYIHPSLKN